MSGDVEDPVDEVGTVASAPGRGVVLYDFLLCRGGAESVALSLVRGIPGNELCVGFREPRAFTATDLADIVHHELADPPVFNMRGWRSISGMNLFRKRGGLIADYDWAIFSGSNAPIAVQHRPRGGNVYYCHTVPRLAYDLYDWYMDRLPRWQRPALRMLAATIRRNYEDALGRMDRIAANSANVQQRLARFLGVSSEVVHPPCDTAGFAWISQGDYFLSTARLEKYKRIDVIIEAFRHMPHKQLVVASGGSDEQRLRRQAGDARNIRFVGWQSEKGLRELVGNARATIYMAKDEDFGMSPVESMAAGKPVIGVAEGGVLETVVDGSTGLLVSSDPGKEELIGAVEQCTPEKALEMRGACERRASLFGQDRFLAHMERLAIDVATGPAA